MNEIKIPTLDEIEKQYSRLQSRVRKTPLWECNEDFVNEYLGENSSLSMKLELFQLGGSFKIRGALTVMDQFGKEKLSNGVVAVSAGNHAVAVSSAAKLMEISAKVVMPSNANKAGINKCKALGAEVILVENVNEAFRLTSQIEEEENRVFIHPFEGYFTTLGTATLGWEYFKQAKNPFDIVIIPIGGGGLASGMASAMKQINPSCMIFGVEPTGANNMELSFQNNEASKTPVVNTIAASLAPPFSLPYSYAVCKKFMEKVVTVSDEDLCKSMAILFEKSKLVLEPAAASSFAAAIGPLKDVCKGKNVGIIACGANIDIDSYCELLQKGKQA